MHYHAVLFAGCLNLNFAFTDGAMPCEREPGDVRISMPPRSLEMKVLLLVTSGYVVVPKETSSATGHLVDDT